MGSPSRLTNRCSNTEPGQDRGLLRTRGAALALSSRGCPCEGLCGLPAGRVVSLPHREVKRSVGPLWARCAGRWLRGTPAGGAA